MKKINVISVKSPTFFVKRNDPLKVSYEHQDLREWKFVQTGSTFNLQCKTKDFLYIYEKDKDNGIRGAVLTREHLKI